MRWALFSKISSLRADLFRQFRTGGLDRTEGLHQGFDLAVIEHVLVNHHPTSLFGVLTRIQFSC